MSHSDLPLFQWQPPCKVVVFPLIKRIGKVRHVAKLLAGKHGEEATLYWKQVVSANRKHLTRIGLGEELIQAELQSFFDAVQSEIVRQTYTGTSNPKGAA